MEKTLEVHLQELRNEIASDLERQATYAMISNEYNFNDTAVRAKTYHHSRVNIGVTAVRKYWLST